MKPDACLCGATPITEEESDFDELGGECSYRLACPECGYSAGCMLTKDAAINDWNTMVEFIKERETT